MHILMTGGGTAGHVVPNLAIADATKGLTKKPVKISYIGSHSGIEKSLIQDEKIPYYEIRAGKFRRYFDLKNLVDLVRIPLGIFQSYNHLSHLKPDVIFSKGGFVGFPVVVAGWLKRIPVIIHESDAIPGLATRLSAPFALKILLAYESALDGLEKFAFKTEVVGAPVRISILKGSKATAKRITGFTGRRPVLLVAGGSTGSKQINDMIKNEKKVLIKGLDIIHLTGAGKGGKKKEKHYFACPYAKNEMKDFYALATFCISRAGANAIAELTALGIPTLLFPLGMDQSRGDQLANARAAAYSFSFFRVANEKSSLAHQLKLLPSRRSQKIANTVAKNIASILIKTANSK